VPTHCIEFWTDKPGGVREAASTSTEGYIRTVPIGTTVSNQQKGLSLAGQERASSSSGVPVGPSTRTWLAKGRRHALVATSEPLGWPMLWCQRDPDAVLKYGGGWHLLKVLWLPQRFGVDFNGHITANG
jgi:hypothetical protein